MIAEAQRRGGICAFIDAEHAMDPQYARRIGVNVDDLLVSQPDTGEQALEIAELLVRSGALDVVAVDSVAALTPKAEIEGEMGDSHVGLQARLMSQALRKLAGTLNRTDTICLFTNQLREKIGVMFGSPETTPGGRALKFYSSVRLDIRRIETLKDGAEALRQPRPRQGRQEQGRAAVQAGRVRHHLRLRHLLGGHGARRRASSGRSSQKSGSYFSFGDERLGQGRQNAASFLREHPDVVQQILQQIQAAGAARAGDLGAAAADRRRRRRRSTPSSTRSRRRSGGSRLGGMTERDDAVEPALRALRSPRPLEPRSSRVRLERRGVGAAEREQALETLERIGYVDDERFARTRAEQLAARGSGDALIRHDLERAGDRRRARRGGARGARARARACGAARRARAAAASRPPATWPRAASARRRSKALVAQED